ncbi:BNR-4 repeat-containing protein [Geofilum rubicundum]|nr:BNR-4 repeat-containing protein [Geofilum rubicundum]
MKQVLSAILLVFVWAHGFAQNQNAPVGSYQGQVVSEEGAWCWFADPRSLHLDNGQQQATYIGYIDVHGNVKASQHDFLTGTTNEVLIRSWFQPDDHNNPTFLVLPDQRIMIFYSRHTDEAAFYYRISQRPGDITSLGEEKRLATSHNTTYPSAYILSDDPNHIYLAWRGINWHPTIAKLSIPDANDDTDFVWGPHQVVQSTGARPYAKYTSNGKDKILMGYTTAHPDNQNPNYVYYHHINVNTLELEDIKGNVVSKIENGPHRVSATNSYSTANPFAVVDNAPYRNWIWEVKMDSDGHPVIAMVRISDDKQSHNYYHARWNGTEWVKTFLANGGGAFHQTPGLEQCYSGGMALDGENPNIVYCSVPVDGTYGEVYEIVKYTINTDGTVSNEAITWNSEKNNVRPYYIPFSGNTGLNLAWMHGDYYDWIVSSSRPEGFPTAIHANFEFPQAVVDLENGLLVAEEFNDAVTGSAHTEKGNLVVSSSTHATLSVADNHSTEFSLSLTPSISHDAYYGIIFSMGDLSWSLDPTTGKPVVTVGTDTYMSQNRLGNSDVWQTASRGTGGQYYPMTKFDFFTLTVTYKEGRLRTYINGLIDQEIELTGLSLKDVVIGGFDGLVENGLIHDRALNQQEVKKNAANLAVIIGLKEFEQMEVPAVIYSDLVLKAEMSTGETISWTSSEPQVLMHSGLVVFPTEATPVILTATMGDHSKDFDVTVMPRDIQNNVVLNYQFESADEYLGPGIRGLRDLSGNDNDARIYGSAKINGQLDLSTNTNSGFSTNGYLLAPDGVIDAIRSYSVVVKVQPDRLDRLPRIFDFGSAASNSIFGRASALTAGYKYNGGTTVLINSPQQLVVGTETHLAFTFDASTKTTKIFINGNEVVTSKAITREPYELAGIAPTNRNLIGRSQWMNADNVDYCGTMDDFKLFNIALTEAEIQAMMINTSLSDTETSPNSIMHILPNPLPVGDNLHISLDLTPEELRDTTVQIINMSGHIIGSFVPQSSDLEIDRIWEKGVYLVRVGSDKKGVHVQKLMVL